MHAWHPIQTVGSCKKWTWWRHQMETFYALLALSARNSPVTDEFPAQRPVTRSFDVFYLRPNKRLSKQSWGCWFETSLGSLWRHSNINNVCIAITNCYALTQVLLWCSFHNNQNKANKHINNPPPKYIQNLLFSLLKYHVRSNKQGQYPGCWCPESLCCRDIISHDISYEQSWYYCFRCDWISRNCAWKNKKSCEIQIYFWSFLRNIQQDKI